MTPLLLWNFSENSSVLEGSASLRNLPKLLLPPSFLLSLSYLFSFSWNSPCKNNKNEQNSHLYISNANFTMKGCPFFVFQFNQEHELIFMYKKVQLSPTSPSVFWGKKFSEFYTICKKIIWLAQKMCVYQFCTFENFDSLNFHCLRHSVMVLFGAF